MTSTTKCPQCGHPIDVTDQLNADVMLIADSLAAKVKELRKLFAEAIVAFDSGPSADHDPPTPNPDGEHKIGCIRKTWISDVIIALNKN